MIGNLESKQHHQFRDDGGGNSGSEKFHRQFGDFQKLDKFSGFCFEIEQFGICSGVGISRQWLIPSFIYNSTEIFIRTKKTYWANDGNCNIKIYACTFRQRWNFYGPFCRLTLCNFYWLSSYKTTLVD